MTYLALLGNTPKLSFAEINQVLSWLHPTLKTQHVQSQIVKIWGESIDPRILLDLLGGTVKIYTLLPNPNNLSAPKLISQHFSSTNKSRFIVTHYPANNSESKILAQKTKGLLSHQGIKSGFRILNNPSSSAGEIDREVEYLFYDGEIAVATAIQDINLWNYKDYHRPAADPKSGMLPPKVARMMINLALRSKPNAKETILDPFCGSGTILMESLNLGLSCFGSDLSSKAISDSQANLNWYTNKFTPTGTYQVLTKDVHHLQPADFGINHVTAIVFEGYLGPPHPKIAQLSNLSKGLKKLYIGALKNVRQFLPKGGRLVCALPEYVKDNSTYNLDPLIDNCEKYGYTQITPSFVYARKNAIVRRKIYTLQKSS